MNKIVVVGRLGEDPQIRQVAGANVCTFSVAENSIRKDANGERITNWFRCSVWREKGDICAKYLHKGDYITVIGDIIPRTYTTKTGETRISLDMTVSDFEFGGRANGAPGQQEAQASPARKPMPSEEDDDLPF